MGIDWVRKTYSVPAKRGMRVAYTGRGRTEYGTICGARGGRLCIRLDGEVRAKPYHPTWQLDYVTSAPVAAKGD